jgi:hypothetical protein
MSQLSDLDRLDETELDVPLVLIKLAAQPTTLPSLLLTVLAYDSTVLGSKYICFRVRSLPLPHSRHAFRTI